MWLTWYTILTKSEFERQYGKYILYSTRNGMYGKTFFFEVQHKVTHAKSGEYLDWSMVFLALLFIHLDRNSGWIIP